MHHVVGGLGKVRYSDDCTIRGSRGNFTLNLIKAKRHRRERVREKNQFWEGKKQTKLGFAAIVSGGWTSADLVYLEFIDFLITPNAS